MKLKSLIFILIFVTTEFLQNGGTGSLAYATILQSSPVNHSIWGDVWNDSNQNGIRELDEEPIEDVTIFLYDNSGVELQQVKTDGVGLFLFSELSEGTYQILYKDRQDTIQLVQTVVLGEINGNISISIPIVEVHTVFLPLVLKR